MDATLRDRIQATLDPNTDTRRQAELDLKYVRLGFVLVATGFLIYCILGRRTARLSQCPPSNPSN